jgi:hypothetical protein
MMNDEIDFRGVMSPSQRQAAAEVKKEKKKKPKPKHDSKIISMDLERYVKDERKLLNMMINYTRCFL